MQSYLDHLLSCINSSIEVAEKESSLLPAHESYGEKEMREWYNDILKWIYRNPPEFFVKYLEVIENYRADIVRVKYIYFDSDEMISEASIKVISELYDV